jgi:signal transduction histidine kinase
MFRSVRARLTLLATCVVLVVLVAAGVALVLMQRRVLTSQVDEALLRHNADLTRAYTANELTAQLPAVGDDDALAQIVGARGAVSNATANVHTQPPVVLLPPDRDELRKTVHLSFERAPYRAIARRAGDAVVITATPLDDVNESVAALRLGLTVAIPLLVAILALTIWWLVGRALRPVELIRARVAEIGSNNLEERVPEPATQDEVARLARTMNAMLDRLQESADRQARFVADASHELRTPLARMRSELEVDLRHETTADLVATHRSVLDETIGMQHLVDDLLELARDGHAPRRRVPVDLDELVRQEAEQLRGDGRVHVDISQVSAAQIPGDPNDLRRAIRNLADNAVRHATSTVSFSLREHEGRAELAVADDGPGIAPAERERVFQRFTRLDPARESANGGAGLGLAIAREVIRRHGGTIHVDDAYTTGARFVVTIPGVLEVPLASTPP